MDDNDDYPPVTCPLCNGTGDVSDDESSAECPDCDGIGHVEACCVCGKASTGLHDDREDCPTCGSYLCGLALQGAIDYHEGRGG